MLVAGKKYTSAADKKCVEALGLVVLGSGLID